MYEYFLCITILFFIVPSLFILQLEIQPNKSQTKNQQQNEVHTSKHLPEINALLARTGTKILTVSLTFFSNGSFKKLNMRFSSCPYLCSATGQMRQADLSPRLRISASFDSHMSITKLRRRDVQSSIGT